MESTFCYKLLNEENPRERFNDEETNEGIVVTGMETISMRGCFGIEEDEKWEGCRIGPNTCGGVEEPRQ